MDSKTRVAGLFISCASRVAIAGLLLLYGTRYLAYTAGIEDLLLNAVALEFVIAVDDLMFEALVPMHVKLVVEFTGLASLGPPKTYHGLGARSAVTFLYVIVSLIVARSSLIVPQYDILLDATDALCAGDR